MARSAAKVWPPAANAATSSTVTKNRIMSSPTCKHQNSRAAAMPDKTIAKPAARITL
jgi:hypothetical protein